MKCPSCEKNAGVVCKCNNCTEIRCSMGSCCGSNNKSGGATEGHKCKTCKKGEYVKIS